MKLLITHNREEKWLKLGQTLAHTLTSVQKIDIIISAMQRLSKNFHSSVERCSPLRRMTTVIRLLQSETKAVSE